MKKTLLFLLTAAIGVSLCAPAQTVTSVNAVGMVKITINSGELAILSNPFKIEDPQTTVSDVFDVLPNGSRVHFWIDQQWVTEAKGRGSWSPNTTQIQRATTVFVDVPSNAASPTYELVFSGEVPGSNEAQTDVLLQAGLNLVSFPYPVERIITEAGFVAQNGDAVHFWNGTAWVTETFGRGQWSPGTTVIQPGQGFFYKSGSNKTWESAKPYLWP